MPIPHPRSSGASLLEVLLCLTILALLNSFAIPQLQNYKMYFDSRATQKSLQALLATARARALYRQQIVTLCPLNNSTSCSSQWETKLSVFIDSNSNAVLDPDEEEILVWDEIQEYASFSWTLDRRYIRFRPNGSTTATTGSLRYCLIDKDSPNNFRIVIARTGRTRVDHKSHGCP